MKNFTLFLVSVLSFCSFVHGGLESIPKFDVESLAVPGQPLSAQDEDARVVSYQFKYAGRFYNKNTSFSDGRYHNAKGVLKTINGVKLYVETGNFAEKIDDSNAYHVEYVIDGNGYRELSRKRVELLGPRISMRAIGTILG